MKVLQTANLGTCNTYVCFVSVAVLVRFARFRFVEYGARITRGLSLYETVVAGVDKVRSPPIDGGRWARFFFCCPICCA